jgi:hypothetical protein
LELFGGLRDDSVCADDVRVDRVWKNFEQPARPCPIGRDYVITTADARSDDPIARSEIGRQAARDSKADDSRSTARNCSPERRSEP